MNRYAPKMINANGKVANAAARNAATLIWKYVPTQSTINLKMARQFVGRFLPQYRIPIVALKSPIMGLMKTHALPITTLNILSSLLK